MADGPAALAGFRRPFAEQVAAWWLRLANQVDTATWRDLWQSQHDSAFVVAGALKADVLGDLAEAVDKAITRGTTLEEFRRDFRRIVETRGWHGWTGEGSVKGEAWRTRVIYQTNMRTSYMAGRHAQLMAGEFKYWVYRHGGSREPRPHHLAWDGVALPPDHPFWAQHYPPNGWGCSCRVFGARTEAGIRRVGGDPGKTLPDGWDAIDGRTGAQAGIDKGWGYAPGASVARTVSSLAGKLSALPQQPSIDLIQSWIRSETFARWVDAPIEPFPVARIQQSDADRLGARTKIVSLSAETMQKQTREHPELSVTEYGSIQAVIENAGEIIQDRPGSLVYIWAPPDGGGHLLVVKATMSGNAIYVTSFRRISGDRADRERLLRQFLRRV